MAANLVGSGMPLTVWNRSPGPLARLREVGAAVAGAVDGLFAASDAVILMLADDGAVDEVLGRGRPEFVQRMRGRLIINMGTHAPSWSRGMADDIEAAGGTFVEAPVSGSRGPAESGLLLAMLAGEPQAVARARPILEPMCSGMVELGAIPSAMRMKLAVNLYLVTSVAALAEAANLAEMSGLDLPTFARAVGSGPLGSDVARAKLDKMARRDFSPDAAIRDVVKNARLIAAAAAEAAADAPLLAESLSRFEAAAQAGHANLDLCAVLTTYEPCGARPV